MIIRALVLRNAAGSALGPTCGVMLLPDRRTGTRVTVTAAYAVAGLYAHAVFVYIALRLIY